MSSSSLQEIIVCLGYPVAGNPTQFVMERAFQAAGVDSRCFTVDVPPDALESAVKGMNSMGFRGGVLADPHRSTVGQFVDRVDREAGWLKSLDLIYRDADDLVGANTMLAAVAEVTKMHRDIAGESALVIGSSRSAKAVSLALALAGVEQLTIMAKDDIAADEISALLHKRTQCECVVQPWLDVYRIPPRVRLVVQTHRSALNAAAEKTVPIEAASVNREMLFLDTDFLSSQTPFLRMANEKGCSVITGLDLLVQRASVAFEAWTGIQPDATIVRDAFEEFLMI